MTNFKPGKLYRLTIPRWAYYGIGKNVKVPVGTIVLLLSFEKTENGTEGGRWRFHFLVGETSLRFYVFKYEFSSKIFEEVK